MKTLHITNNNVEMLPKFRQTKSIINVIDIMYYLLYVMLI